MRPQRSMRIVSEATLLPATKPVHAARMLRHIALVLVATFTTAASAQDASPQIPVPSSKTESPEPETVSPKPKTVSPEPETVSPGERLADVGVVVTSFGVGTMVIGLITAGAMQLLIFPLILGDVESRQTTFPAIGVAGLVLTAIGAVPVIAGATMVTTGLLVE